MACVERGGYAMSHPLEYVKLTKVEPFATWGFVAAGCGLAALGMIRAMYRFEMQSLWWGAILLGAVAGISGLLGLIHGRSRVYRFGMVLSLAGILCGGGVVAWAMVLPLSCRMQCGPTAEGLCRINLKTLGQAAMLYATDHQGRYPAGVAELLEEEIKTSDFVCPSTKDTPATQPTAADVTAGGHLSYVYVGGGFTAPVPPGAIIAYEPLCNHQMRGMNVLFGDGRVEWVEAKEARNMLAELAAGRNPPGEVK